jgi:hypothetical protein
MNTKIAHTTSVWLTTMTLTIIARLSDALDRRTSADDNDRGDVPGWVMITMMTAIVVIALIGIFRDQVTAAVTNAFQSVANSKG